MQHEAPDAFDGSPSAALLAGCGAFGPTRNPPHIAAPTHYSVAEPATVAGGRRRRAAADAGAPPMPEWWKVYQSDDLDALVAEGCSTARPSLPRHKAP